MSGHTYSRDAVNLYSMCWYIAVALEICLESYVNKALDTSI
jgi:hypothetical protein